MYINKNFWKFLIIQVLLLLLIQYACCKPTLKPKNESQKQSYVCGKKPSVVHYIYGGRQSMIENWPWQVHLKITDPGVNDDMNYDYANCGASIISNVWIITAAHCFSERKNPKIFLLMGQNITKKSHYREIKYDKIILHPKYEEFIGSHEYSTNDIALVKLNYNHRLKGRITPLCLPEKDAILPTNSICYITGFGATNKDDTEQIKRLREGRVAIKPDLACVRSLSLEFFDSKSMICAGKTRSHRANSCQGDSGGPLVCEGNFDSNSEATSWYLFGVTSFGALDCGLYSNSVYTKVSNYVDWLRNTTGMK